MNMRKMTVFLLTAVMLCALTACQDKKDNGVETGKPRTPKTDSVSTPTPSAEPETPTPTEVPATPTPTDVPATPTPTPTPTPITPLETMRDSLGIWGDGNEWFISLKEHSDGSSLVVTTGYRYDTYYEKTYMVSEVISSDRNGAQLMTPDGVIKIGAENDDGIRVFSLEGKDYVCSRLSGVTDPYTLKEVKIEDFMFRFEGYYITTTGDNTYIDMFSYGENSNTLTCADYFGRFGTGYNIKSILVADNGKVYYLNCDQMPEPMDDGPCWVRWEDLGGITIAYASAGQIYRQVTWDEYQEETFPTFEFILDLYQKDPDSAVSILSNYHARTIAERWEKYIISDEDIFVTYQKPGGPALVVKATDDYIVVQIEQK